MKEKNPEYAEFDELFDAADITYLAAEDVIPYSQSRMKLREEEESLMYYGELQRKEGIKEGESRTIKGIVERLKEKGMSLSEIANIIGYSNTDLEPLMQ